MLDLSGYAYQGGFMRRNHLSAVLAIATVLAGCGSDEKPIATNTEPAAALVQAQKSSAPALAQGSSEPVAAARDCPPTIATPARSDSAPVDDILGVRPGLTYDEAAAVVECADARLKVVEETSRGYQMNLYGMKVRQGFNAREPEPQREMSSQEIMRQMQDEAMARGSNRVKQDLQPGQSKFYVSTMGLPGEERVVSVAREQWFEEGRNPPVESVFESLIKKYGTPTERNPNNPNFVRWNYDSMQRLITESSPLYMACQVQATPDAGNTLTPDCGLSIAALVWPLKDNPDLAQFMQITVVDQGGGFAALEATQAGLDALDAQRRQGELENAKSNADAPEL